MVGPETSLRAFWNCLQGQGFWSWSRGVPRRFRHDGSADGFPMYSFESEVLDGDPHQRHCKRLIFRTQCLIWSSGDDVLVV
ncbi:MAG: hypothetical protein ACI91Q_000585 [Gammaproteobacteria bacterium]|jgi:hypothetical protein